MSRWAWTFSPPGWMTALLLYAYATGERSSRQIEARCRRDIGHRVICANQVSDHTTIARFRADHETVLGQLFTDILRLCAAAGLGKLGAVALDGTKLAASAALAANRTAERIDAEVAVVDAAEDQAYGPDRRGDELQAELADPRSRLARLRAAKHQTAAGIDRPIGAFLADAGYWREAGLKAAARDGGPELLIATQKAWQERRAAREQPPPRGRIPGHLSARERMERKLRTKRGRALYRQRSVIVEPVFGQAKEVRRIRRFSRRGQRACAAEWKFICATHNLLKLWRTGRRRPNGPSRPPRSRTVRTRAGRGSEARRRVG